MEIALLLGLTGKGAPEPLRSRAGALRPEAIAMLGIRDEKYRREIGVATVADQLRLLTADDVHADPARAGRQAGHQVASQAPGWWLHIDLDVLAGASSAPAAPRTIPTCRAACPGRSSPSWRHLPCEPAAAAAGASVSTTPTWIPNAARLTRS